VNINTWNEDARRSMLAHYQRPGMGSKITEARDAIAYTLQKTNQLPYLQSQAARLVNGESQRIENILNSRGIFDADGVETLYFALAVFQMFDTWINSFDDMYAQAADTGELVTTTTTTEVQIEDDTEAYYSGDAYNGGGYLYDGYSNGY
jgi:hypothetical protein